MRDIATELEALYRQRYVAFRNGMLAVTGSLEAARDAVQEGFARALRDRAAYRGEGPLESWLWRIMFRAALEARRNGRQRTIDDALELVSVVERERDPALAAALVALPPRRRLVVFLRYFADLPYTEIAAVCGISEGTVAATLAHAHADLLRALNEEGAAK